MTQHLLMIEDDHRLAGMVGEYLTQSGFAVRHAPDGASGLEILTADIAWGGRELREWSEALIEVTR